MESSVEASRAGGTVEAGTCAEEQTQCDGCRKRKLRCSKEWPTCSHCRRLDSECRYDYQRKKPGLKSGIVDALSRRIEALETAVFHDEVTRCTPPPAPTAGSHVSHTPSSDLNALGIVSELAQVLQSLSSNLASLNNPSSPGVASSSIRYNSIQPNGIGSSPNIPRKRARLERNVHYDLPVEHSRFLTAPHMVLSSPDMVEELLDSYFEHIHPWIPILHEAQFRKNILDEHGRNRNSIILHAIIVAALRLVEGESAFVPVEQIVDVVRGSRDTVVLNAMDDLTLQNLQALIIITFTDISQGETSKAWSTIGSLTRTVQYLHLSIEEPGLDDRATLLPNLPSLAAPQSWIEEEERRRVFWNIFLLDSWNVSLTADDVCRRLPVDGGLWRRSLPAVTPYLGLWDHSAAKIGNTITFLRSKYENAGRATGSGAPGGDATANSNSPHTDGLAPAAMPNIGAFAYYIESVESLSRINAYFLQQKIDFANRQEVSNWLTRFKELDLRLVHWKLFLPQKWKDPNRAPNPTVAMDPNMTLAHITHNTSLILLHQQIGYPRGELRQLRLPNTCSAETCLVAALETANITVNYLEHALVRRVIAPHFVVCVFVSAKTLLVHSLYYYVPLAPEFWTLVKSLETMSRTWKGRLVQADNGLLPLAGSLAAQLHGLHELCQRDSAHALSVLIRGAASGNLAGKTSDGYGNPSSPPRSFIADQLQPEEVRFAPVGSPGLLAPDLATDDLSAISECLMDQSFLEMNRIIHLDDFMFFTDNFDTERSGL
ncbi:hypothetical protein GQ53DRAFT_780440 [Thozetella sp. PMI_491]|nr:hypothetical protein GQ53DRAFT_780440 [Thozetella sp. PMI_491]